MAFGLEGVKVIQTATVWAGPLAARLLADWGADVIFVEPVRGETSRNPRYRAVEGKDKVSTVNPVSENYNRNKRGITLDLSQERGREIIYRLLEKADVFLSNFRPRELEKFRLDYKLLSQLNRRLVHANITGYGRKGPDRNLPAYGNLGVCRSGLQHLLALPGMDPVVVPYDLPDNIAALALACGIMAALFIRERTGRGQEVDTSLFHSMVFAVSAEIAEALVTGQDQQQAARKDYAYAVRNYYQTRDGRWLRLSLANPDPYWSSLCRAVEREDIEHDPRFELFEPRMENHAALFHILEEAFLSKTLAEWRVRLTDAGIPWSPVQNLPEVIADPQARANDFFVPFDHPSHGHTELIANPVTLSNCPQTIRMPAPELGQHTEEVLLEHGYTRPDIARFREQGVIA